jgi:stage III sporulation protein AC
MNIDLLFKIAGVGILVSVISQVLTKSGREEQATLTTLTRFSYCTYDSCK